MEDPLGTRTGCPRTWLWPQACRCSRSVWAMLLDGLALWLPCVESGFGLGDPHGYLPPQDVLRFYFPRHAWIEFDSRQSSALSP